MPSFKVSFSVGEVIPPSRRSFETVERKGIGHPDTIADVLAEVFCFRYANYCMDRMGFVPNHSADKVTLAGADAVVKLGGYTIVEPIGAYLFGKVTREVGTTEIPVDDLFAGSADDVLSTCTRYPQVAQHIRKQVKAVVGNPIDHHPGYYKPESMEQLRSIMTNERLSNDTVACAAAGGMTPVERLVMGLERYLQGPELAREVPGTGSDIKVLAVRDGRSLDLTACVPFHPEALDSWDDYDERLAHVYQLATAFVSGQQAAGVDEFTLHLNKRDIRGRGYLAPFGTCLGKGDIGAVGRGNRYSGLITPGRSMSVEAPAGKNLVHHAGKLYTILAQRIADFLFDHFGVENEVIVTSRVGSGLADPSSVCVNVAEDCGPAEKVESVVRQYVAEFDKISQELISSDPLAAVRAEYGITSELGAI